MSSLLDRYILAVVQYRLSKSFPWHTCIHFFLLHSHNGCCGVDFLPLCDKLVDFLPLCDKFVAESWCSLPMYLLLLNCVKFDIQSLVLEKVFSTRDGNKLIIELIEILKACLSLKASFLGIYVVLFFT